MKIAELRNKVEFFEEQKVENDTFGFDHRWVSVIQTRGKLETLIGTQFTRGENAEPSDTHKLTIRTREIKPTYRVKVRDTFYAIVQINRIIEGRSRYIEMDLEEDKVDV